MNSLYKILTEKFGDNLKKLFKDEIDMLFKLDIDYVCDVPFDKIAVLDSMFENSKNRELKKYKFNVSGNHEYISNRKAKLEIRLDINSKGHYSVITNTVKGIAYTDKKIVIFEIQNSQEVSCYGEQGPFMMPYDEFTNHRAKPRSSPILLVYRDQKTLKETYDIFISDADIMLELTNGLINMYQTGKDKNTALKLFYNSNDCVLPEPIQDEEAQWLMNSTKGAMVFAEEYAGQCYKYDYVSNYPSLMIQESFLIPMKRGTFTTVDGTQKHYKCGIYRCIIDIKNSKLLKQNDLNYYCHTDINRAIELKYNIEFIDDGEPNALIYERSDCVTGKQLFKKYVDILFPLKQKCKRVKKLLAILHGALAEKHICDKMVDLDKPQEHQFSMYVPVAICPVDGDGEDFKVMVSYDIPTKRYATDYGRLETFLLASGRNRMSRLFTSSAVNNVDDIVRCHTDSVFSKTKLKCKTGNDLDELKYEGYCENVIIKNIRKPIGDFICSVF